MFNAFDATFNGDAPYFKPLSNFPFNNHCKIIKNTQFCFETVNYQFASRVNRVWRGWLSLHATWSRRLTATGGHPPL